MGKYIVGLVAAFVLFPVAASAMVDIDFLVVDGGPNTTVEPGDNVAAKVTFDTDGEDVESFSWRLVGSDIPKVCVNTVDVTNPDGGTFVRSFTIDLTTQGEGTWDVEVKSYGDNGADASNLCESMDENDSTTFPDRITIEDDIDDNQDPSNDNGNGNGNDDDDDVDQGDLDDLTASINELTKLIKAFIAAQQGGGGGGGHNAGVCAALSAWSHLHVGSRGVQVSALQQYLMTHGGSIPAISSGMAAAGYFGPQTAAALWTVLGNNGCN